MQIPVTRPKSPKLGRDKSFPASAEGNGSRSSRSDRLSLNNEVSHNSLAKESPQLAKRPLRKSLPKLPSEKSTLTIPTDASSPKPVLRPQDLDDTEKRLPAEQSQTDANQHGPASTDKQLKPTQETVNEAEPSAE